MNFDAEQDTHGHAHHHHNEPDNSIEATIPECGFIQAVNKGEGFASVGWRFESKFKFDQNKLFAFLSGINAERLKSTFITDNGCFAYNLIPDALTELSLDGFDENRIEIIAKEVNDQWEEGLFK